MKVLQETWRTIPDGIFKEIKRNNFTFFLQYEKMGDGSKPESLI